MRWRTAPDAAGERVDSYLAAELGEARNQIARWIRQGRVRVDGEPTKSSTRLTGGEWIECEPIERDSGGSMTPEEGPLVVLHEDADLVVIDKPAGLVVHPGAGRAAGTLAHRLLHHYPETRAVGGPGRPGIVHRLDRDTSGVLVVARTPEAYAGLSSAFAERQVAKTYVALVYGAPRPAAGTIDAPIARHPTRRKEMSVLPHGRPARTHYRTLSARNGLAALEVDLETGRTHQIRVHLRHLGHPLVGDPVYGEARWKGLERPLQRPLAEFSRPALHAWRIAFRHPTTSDQIACLAPLPEDLETLWSRAAGEQLSAKVSSSAADQTSEA